MTFLKSMELVKASAGRKIIIMLATGFGLGLSPVKLMMAAHGGRVDLHSRLGEGVTIELFFPAAGPENRRS